ncbi:MAG: phospho-N-acetylmuramoyl-pentapeptide-transferase [Vampirovibrio sp.]|nr:phospho-N-acetylmuramoyl-pentapeptide-transferase [Vampirovibrio sp.]
MLQIIDLKFLYIPVFSVMAMGVLYIPLLKSLMLGQHIREDGPKGHHKKAGTPTAGGVIILLGAAIGLTFAYFNGEHKDLFTQEVWAVVAATFILGLLGLWDDAAKILKKHNKGVSGYTKLAVQALVGTGIGWMMMSTYGVTKVTFFNFGAIDLGILYPLFGALMIAATSNAVNLTDGLDGLAGATVSIALLSFVFLFAGTLFDDIAGAYPDLAMVALCLLGGVMGFLFFNYHPAKIFMGDTGSLALGGAIGALGLVSGSDFWLVLIGGIFMIETLSVIIQVISFKTTGNRVFKMSPIHHHFELCGWSENQVVIVFSACQFAMCAAAVYFYNKGW